MSDLGCIPDIDCTYSAARGWAFVLLALLLLVIVGGPVLFDWLRQKWMIRGLNKQEKKLGNNADLARREIQEKLARWQRPLRVRVLGVIMGHDERLSTTKTIALLWTLVVAYVFLALILIGPSDWDTALTHLDGAYLGLLGGPIATVVLSKAVVSTRVRRGTIQKTEGDGVPRLTDLVADDSGDTDLFDLQYVLFNAVAMIFVLVGFSRATLLGFPEVPDALWLLTGGPAAVFVSNKAFGTNAPAIFSVDPPKVRRGQTFTIYGQNFIVGDTVAPAASAGQAPPGPPVEAADKVTVHINGIKAGVVQATAVSVVATVPPDLPSSDSGSAVLTVVTDARTPCTRSDQLAIISDPVVNPIAVGQPVAPGGTFVLTGAWNPEPGRPTVLINDVLANTADGNANEVTVTVPPATPKGPVQVVVLDTVGRSTPVTLTVS